MIKINKISKGSAIDFAAEELKKYMRMMMPEANEIDIDYDPEAKDGFRLGLYSAFGLSDDVDDPRYDDNLYAECDALGGIIAGNNPRSVLLSVYEYLRRNGCRWLMPGPDGEYIPMRDALDSVSFSVKPSCRYRGFANTTAASAQTTLEFVDFLPKIGMNTFMFEFRIPTFYTDNYYDHKRNNKNRKPERTSKETILQWKRGAECEAKKRDLVFHDVGHGFCIDAFGIDSCLSWYEADESIIPDESRQYLAFVDGKRGFYRGVPINTNICMSNATARRKVAEYVSDYAAGHRNVDLLHVWLADGCNNHCECDECKKKSPSDYYVDMLNDIDELMTERGIDTKIVFLAYVDTSWAPDESYIKNQDRFVFMLAPFTRTYYKSIPENGINIINPPYERNNIYLGKTLEAYLKFYLDWRENFGGPAFSFDYHFCWTQYYDFSRFIHSKTIHDEICLYKELGINGVVEDGDLRFFMPNGLAIYTLARTLFDTSLSVEEIKDDYMSVAYGKDAHLFEAVLKKLGDCFDHAYLSRQNSKDVRVSTFYNPDVAKKLEEKLPEALKEARALIESHYNSAVRIETVSVRLLEHYLDLWEGVAPILICKARANDEEAKRLYREFELNYGKRECEIERYFNQCFFFNWLDYMIFQNDSKREFVL